MPTLLFIDGFRFFFYNNENNEPIHVHVEKAEATDKIGLLPDIQIAYLIGFTSSEKKKLVMITENNLE